jgi:putative phosphoribosyl transferase
MAETTPVETTTVTVPIHRLRGPSLALHARLSLPPLPEGLVVLAAAADSRAGGAVAATLHESWIGTLVVDLLVEDELAERHNSRDLPLLAERFLASVRLIDSLEYTRHLPLGFFGTGRAGGAAILAATREPRLTAVVSHQGWHDLSAEKLAAVRAPTLLIVSSADEEDRRMNQRTLTALRCKKRLVFVPGPETPPLPNANVGEAAWMATEWFAEHLDR